MKSTAAGTEGSEPSMNRMPLPLCSNKADGREDFITETLIQHPRN